MIFLVSVKVSYMCCNLSKYITRVLELRVSEPLVEKDQEIKSWCGWDLVSLFFSFFLQT